MGKIRVEELAQQMGLPSKEVLFLLQSIGVDVKSPQAALDETTVMAILQGKTHAPKQLIVRDTEARASRPTKSALSRIKIIDRHVGAKGAAAPTAEEAEKPVVPEPEVPAAPPLAAPLPPSLRAAARPAPSVRRQSSVSRSQAACACARGPGSRRVNIRMPGRVAQIFSR